MGCSMEEFDIHEKGLHRIVQFRGGLDDDTHGTVARLSQSL